MWLVADRFEVEWRPITERRVEATGVIEALDVVEDCPMSVGRIEEAAAEQVLEFEGAPKRLHGGVVVAIGATAHRSDQAMAGQSGAVGSARVLDAAIGVNHDAWRRPASGHGLFEGGQHQGGLQGGGRRPTDDAATAQIHDRRQIQPPGRGLDISDVGTQTRSQACGAATCNRWLGAMGCA